MAVHNFDMDMLIKSDNKIMIIKYAYHYCIFVRGWKDFKAVGGSWDFKNMLWSISVKYVD